MLKNNSKVTPFKKAVISKNSISKVDNILHEIIHGNHHTRIEANAIIGHGIRKSNRSRVIRFKRIFSKRSKKYSFTQLIPASGSGSRLFKSLIQFANNFDLDNETFSSYINRVGAYKLNDFFQSLRDFPFYIYLKKEISDVHLKKISSDQKKLEIAKIILLDKDLNLCNLPKALVPMHIYKDEVKTVFEEQIDSYDMLKSNFSKSTIHFTIDEDKLANFDDAISRDLRYNNRSDIEFSHQDPKSHVNCITEDNKLVMDNSGNDILKPSGHGALIKNLNNIDSDLIHISNIDNISCKKYQKYYIEQRKYLIGYTLFCKKQIHLFLVLLENDKLDHTQTKKLSKFLAKYFHIDLEQVLLESIEGFRSTVYHLLNAPIRICGMIKNEGSPGGAPYWALNSRGINSLQIVESKEININTFDQADFLNNSTHFNPVDIVIYTKDYRGNKFDLTQFASDDVTMVVKKTQEEKEITFIENTGLWNGGMRDYLTMFLDTKKRTFNPVKEITDLLTKYHNGNN